MLRRGIRNRSLNRKLHGRRPRRRTGSAARQSDPSDDTEEAQAQPEPDESLPDQDETDDATEDDPDPPTEEANQDAGTDDADIDPETEDRTRGAGAQEEERPLPPDAAHSRGHRSRGH